MRVLRISHSAVVGAWRTREHALRRRGVDLRLLSARAWNEGGALVPLVAEPGESIEGVRTWGRHPALFLYDPLPIWRALGESWDLVDIHEEPFALATAEILLLRWLRRQRAPYLLYSAQNLAKRYPPPFRWLERWSLRHASGIHVCNRAAGTIVEAKGYPGRATLIPLGLDTTHFTPPASERPGTRTDERVAVGYVGRLASHKGIDVLMRAVAMDARLVLRVAGDGPDTDELQAEVTRLGLDDRVTFVGSMGQDELPSFYRGLDVLAVPSLTTPTWVEQFGRVAVEAMACGIPVVASDSGALPDVVRGAGLLVPPGDERPLAEALLRAGQDEAIREVLREHGMERARSCDWERVAEQHLALYLQAVHQPITHPDSRCLEVITVAYGAPELLRSALDPVADLPVTVVDNSSSSAVRAVCEEVGAAYVDPGFNGGFATGVNTGLAHRRTDGDVLLLNPDAEIDRDAVHTLHEALMRDRDLASVGPAQVDDTGRPSRVWWPFPSPWGTWTEALGLGRLRRGRRGFVVGSVLLIRAEALAQVGGFDERFFLYAEETDWARRAARLGWHHAVVPEARARHLGAATSSDPRRRESHFHASQERYLRKHHGAVGWQTARVGQLAGCAVRMVVLPGDRGRAARERFALYWDGPARRESRPPSAESYAARVRR